MALMRKRRQPPKGVKNLGDYPVGSVRVVLGNKLPDVIKVCEGFRV
jgi:hypothetical protein